MFRIFDKIQNNEVYVIAEMSANHGGSLENALRIVREVAKTGADCLKIQTYTADSITIDCDNEYFHIKDTLWDGYKLYDLYRDAGTPYEWQEQIKNECEALGLDFLSTPFDNGAVDFLESIGCEAYKIASFELVDIPLIEYAASKGKPMIMSCGMASAEEIADAVEACKRMGNEQIVLLKCCSEYPANWEDMHLANIPDMLANYGVPVGLSDHSEGYLAAVVGVSMGACVVEKHVKLEGVESADSAFSMTMEGFAEMVKAVKDAKIIAGTVKYGPTEGEKKLLPFRRSLFVVKDVKEGEVFTTENVRSIRPSQGMPTKYMANILGKKALCDIAYGTPLSTKCVKLVPSLNTKRLILSEITEEDTQVIMDLRNDPEVFAYFLNPHALELEEHLKWFHNTYEKDPDRFDWLGRDENGKVVGTFRLKRNGEIVEASYLVAKEFYGQGYAKEALLKILSFAKEVLGCTTAIAEIHKENEKSLRFIQKLGFEKKIKEGNFYTYQRTL